MARTADTMATTHRERKPPKQLSHIEVHEGENGGHILRHVHTHSMDHPSEDHIFGKGQSSAAHEHLATSLNMPMTDVGAGEGSEEKQIESKEAAQA
jgi:hypothetical protein